MSKFLESSLMGRVDQEPVGFKLWTDRMELSLCDINCTALYKTWKSMSNVKTNMYQALPSGQQVQINFVINTLQFVINLSNCYLLFLFLGFPSLDILGIFKALNLSV